MKIASFVAPILVSLSIASAINVQPAKADIKNFQQKYPTDKTKNLKDIEFELTNLALIDFVNKGAFGTVTISPNKTSAHLDDGDFAPGSNIFFSVTSNKSDTSIKITSLSYKDGTFQTVPEHTSISALLSISGLAILATLRQKKFLGC